MIPIVSQQPRDTIYDLPCGCRLRFGVLQLLVAFNLVTVLGNRAGTARVERSFVTTTVRKATDQEGGVVNPPIEAEKLRYLEFEDLTVKKRCSTLDKKRKLKALYRQFATENLCEKQLSISMRTSKFEVSR